ncbi:hypothetical protein ACFX13_022206 [Malus domestica]
MCVNLRAPWQGRLAKMPKFYSHSRKLPTRLLAQKSKRHHPQNLESQTPNRITFLKIEETLSSESQESDSQQDCFLKNRRGTALRISRAKLQQDYVLKNRRGTALRISRARLPTGLLSQKSKRHYYSNLEGQTPNKISFSKIEEAQFSESREPDPRQDCLFENRRGTALRTSRARFPWIKLIYNLHTQHQLSKYHRPLFQNALTKLKYVKLAASTTLL